MISDARHKQLLSGMNSTAKKVYEVTPLRDEWTAQMVLGHLARSGVSTTLTVVAGSLGALCRAGLVRQSEKGFQRIEVRKARKGLEYLKDMPVEQSAYPELKEMQKMTTNPPVATPAPNNIVDHIGNLAQRLNAMALRHADERAELARRQRAQMEELAHGISDAAIDVQAALETNETDLGKYRQLKSLLAGV